MEKLSQNRVIIHFDYDCFYASVVENEQPALKSLPLAIQQKQIIVTCNYEARRRGLRKLQLITDAKKICPDVVIVLGEELGRFRDASKLLYKALESFTWSGKVERLGFDEVFMDVTDIVDYNQSTLNLNDLEKSFFQLNRLDPTIGFPFNATKIAGHGYPDHTAPYDSASTSESLDAPHLRTRLLLGSHFAQHLRLSLEDKQGYSSTVGISTSKLLSKLVGNMNKPKAGTTLLPPYRSTSNGLGSGSNVTRFIDGHDIGKIPGIGFNMAHRIRDHVLSRPAQFDQGLIYGGTKENVTVRDVRLCPNMGPELLESILGGPGSVKGVSGRVWNLINGIDDAEVKYARKIPTQISMENSYMQLDTFAEVTKEMRLLANSLVRRMHRDLLEPEEAQGRPGLAKRWTAHPKTLRLSTRPRAPLNSDGTRSRSFNRISRSGPTPGFMFSLKDDAEHVVEKLVQENLLPMFRKLHPHKSGWNLSLINIAVTNMIETASDSSAGSGRDIGQMFKKQDDVLKDWKVEDRDVPPDPIVKETSKSLPDYGSPLNAMDGLVGSEDSVSPTQESIENVWEEEDNDAKRCDECGAVMPSFALVAHERFHQLQ